MSDNQVKRVSLPKVGVLKVPNGTYEKDGKVKKRYHEVGVVFATPHHSRLAIKMHATANGPGGWASVFYDEGKSPRDIMQAKTPSVEEF